MMCLKGDSCSSSFDGSVGASSRSMSVSVTSYNQIREESYHL